VPDLCADTPPFAIDLLPVGEPGAGPYAVTVGSDDALWVTLIHAGQIARVTTEGVVQLYQLEPSDCQPSQIITGPDGALWFTRMADDRIGRIGLDGRNTTFPVSAGSAPFGIAHGPDGALWFTALRGNRIGRLALDGDLTEFELPSPDSMPSMITAGADGALWFTLNQGNAIGRCKPGDRPTVHPLATPNAGPVGIATTGDGIAFVEILAGQLGRIGVDGRIVELPLPDRGARPHAVTVDAAGTGCWVSQWGTSSLLHVNAVGEFREVSLPDGSEPHGIALGSDGALWVALESGYLARVRQTAKSRLRW
jgi:virginiamycin B lyase